MNQNDCKACSITTVMGQAINHIKIHTCVHTYIHIYINAYLHIYIYIYIYTPTQNNFLHTNVLIYAQLRTRSSHN